MPYGRRTTRRTTKRRRTVTRARKSTGGVLGYNAYNIDSTNDHIKSPLHSAAEDIKRLAWNKKVGDEKVKRINEFNAKTQEKQRVKQATKDELNSWSRWAETNVPAYLGAGAATTLSLIGVPIPVSGLLGGAVDVAGVGLSELITGHDHDTLGKMAKFGIDVGFEALRMDSVPKELRYGANIVRSIDKQDPMKAAYYGGKMTKQYPRIRSYLREPIRNFNEKLWGSDIMIKPSKAGTIGPRKYDWLSSLFAPSLKKRKSDPEFQGFSPFPEEFAFERHSPFNDRIEERFIGGELSPVKLVKKAKRGIRLPSPVKDKRFGLKADKYRGLLDLADALSDTDNEYEYI